MAGSRTEQCRAGGVNWADTPLLVYGSIIDHPAHAVAARLLHGGGWGSSVQVMLELYQVLTRTYAVEPQDAAAQIDRLTLTTVRWAALDAAQAMATVRTREQHGIDSTDAHLLQLAQKDEGTLVTLDRRL